MRAKVAATLLTALLLSMMSAGVASNQDEVGRASLSAPPACIGSNGGLAKTARAQATSYLSSYFNVSYRCPSGWSIGTLDTTPTGFSITSTRAGRATIHIEGKKFATPAEARNFNGWSCFRAAKSAFDSSSGKMPSIFSIWDTAFGPGIASVGINLKYAQDTNLAYQKQFLTMSESFSIYQHELWYFTTVDDYTLNKTPYYQHWIGLTFGDTTTSSGPVLLKAASIQPFTIANNTLVLPADLQKRLKLDLYDYLGKRVARLYDSENETARVINLDKSTGSSSNYLLKATTTDGSEYYKIFIRR